MAFGDRLSGLSTRLDAHRRRGDAPGPAPAFDWPQGSPPFDVDALKGMLRRGWKLEHLGREPTAEEVVEAGVIVETLGTYVASLPLDLGDEAAAYLVHCLTMEPKAGKGTKA